MGQFPGMTPDYIFYKCNVQQFFLWYDRAVERMTGEHIHRDKTTVNDIYDKFEYSDEKQKWVIKNGDTSR